MGTGLNLNYRNKKINFYGSYNYSFRKGFNNLTLYRKFSQNNQVQTAFDQNNLLIFPFNFNNAKAGLDYFVSKKTTVGIQLNGIDNRFKPNGENTTFINDGNQQLLSSFRTSNRSQDRWSNYAINFNLKHTFDSTGRELTIDADHALYDNQTYQNFTTRYFDGMNNPLNTAILKGDLSGNLYIYSFKADYTHPLGKQGKVEAGFKTSFVKTDNDVKFFNVIESQDVYDKNKSNHFIYKENINAAYLNYQRQFKKINIQLGLRGEQTVADGNQLTTGATFNRNYFQLFPSVFITQQINKLHQIGYSYSRRIDRPSYQQLNPFRFFLDPTTYREGNPFLLPQLTHSFELSHTYKQTIISTLSYSRTTNNITSVLLQNDAERVTVQTDKNIATFEYVGLLINAPWPIAKWWNANTNFNSYYGHYIGDVAGGQLNNGSVNFNLNVSNTFTLPNGFTAELSGFYRSREVYGISTIKSLGQLSLGIQKTILNRKGTVRLNISDVFYTQQIRGSTHFNNINETFRSRRESRVGMLTFTYRFGKNTVAPSRRRSTGVEDEKRRVNTGGNG